MAPPAGPPGGPPPGGGKGKGLGGLARRKPGLVAGGAAIAGVAGIALYRSHSKAAAAGTAASPADTTGYADTGTATPYDYAGGYGGGGGYNGSGYDAQAAVLQQQLLAYTSQLSAIEATDARQNRQIGRLQHPPRPKPAAKRRRPAPRKPVPPRRGKR
jgi:hypothetical protein